MTIRRFGIALVVLSLGYGCAEAGSLKDGGASTGSGGNSSEVGGGTGTSSSSTSASGGSTGQGSSKSTATSKGGTGTQTSDTTPAGGNTGTSTKTTTTPTTTVVTPSSCDGATGELTAAHKAQAGGSGYTGTTTISPGTVATFNADAVQMKICFSTIGAVPAGLTAASMKIYHASIGGGTSPYIELTSSTPISVEKPDTSRFCFLFDLTKDTKAAGVTVAAPAILTYNWSFDSTQVSGLSLDTRPQNKPQIMVFYNDAIAACADPIPPATTTTP